MFLIIRFCHFIAFIPLLIIERSTIPQTDRFQFFKLFGGMCFLTFALGYQLLFIEPFTEPYAIYNILRRNIQIAVFLIIRFCKLIFFFPRIGLFKYKAYFTELCNMFLCDTSLRIKVTLTANPPTELQSGFRFICNGHLKCTIFSMIFTKLLKSLVPLLFVFVAPDNSKCIQSSYLFFSQLIVLFLIGTGNPNISQPLTEPYALAVNISVRHVKIAVFTMITHSSGIVCFKQIIRHTPNHTDAVKSHYSLLGQHFTSDTAFTKHTDLCNPSSEVNAFFINKCSLRFQIAVSFIILLCCVIILIPSNIGRRSPTHTKGIQLVYLNLCQISVD